MRSWSEATFLSFDGVEIFYRYMLSDDMSANTLVFLHRGHEHSGRVVEFAEQLADGKYSCFAYDMRGHGLSGGPTAWAESFDTWIKDLNSFIGMLHARHQIKTENIVVVANSVGSAMAVSWIINYGARIKGIILGAPAFSIRLYVPFAYSFLKFASFFSDKLFVTSYVKSALLTSDVAEAERYDNDPKITKKIGVNILVSLLASMEALFKRLEDFETPVLLISAGKDYIVRNSWHARFVGKISSKQKTHIVMADYKHAIFHEKDRADIIRPCQEFISSLFAKTNTLPAIVEPRLHTLNEYQGLQSKGSKPLQLYYWSFRRLLETLGKQSLGVSIGLKQGFDSGVSLDYVYQNTPSGSSRLGKALDRMYLNSVGWRNIRKRKAHLVHTLEALARKMVAENIKPVILDLACGAGRYLFEAQSKLGHPAVLCLNDVDPAALDKARELAAHHNATEVHYSQYDIFKAELTDGLEIQPNIVIVSGVFELYHHNDLLLDVLKRLHAKMADKSYLIYSGQPWHPQLQLIARLLNNRLGQRWIMRRRIQREMDELVAAAGFQKINTLADDMGIFTISCAAKRSE